MPKKPFKGGVEKFEPPVRAVQVSRYPAELLEVKLLGRIEIGPNDWRLTRDDLELLKGNVYEPNEAVQADLVNLHQRYVELLELWERTRAQLTPIPTAPPKKGDD